MRGGESAQEWCREWRRESCSVSCTLSHSYSWDAKHGYAWGSYCQLESTVEAERMCCKQETPAAAVANAVSWLPEEEGLCGPAGAGGLRKVDMALLLVDAGS